MWRVSTLQPPARADLPMRPAKVYPIVKALTDRGFATHRRRQAWDISERGRAWFEANGINELRLFV